MDSILEPWQNTDIAWPEFLSTTGANSLFDWIFHILMFLLSLSIVIYGFLVWGANYNIPNTPKITNTTRVAFSDAGFNTDDLMINYQVATAAYGGIYTEQGNSLSNFNGYVNPDAVDDQIAAGARAIIFDVWPNPTSPTQPCVAAMEQNAGWWNTTGGLTTSTTSQLPGISNGGFSNWKRVTRNVWDLSSMLARIADAPLNDPFFVILNLHGAMTTTYLNTVGGIIINAFDGRRMSTEYDKNGGAGLLCSAKVSAFTGKIFTIANIVIDSGFQSLPGSTTQATVNYAALTAATFAESINLLSGTPQNNIFSIPGSSTISTRNIQPCSTKNDTGLLVPLPQTTFAVIQPTTGSLDTTNDTQYTGTTSFLNCLGTGAQFVGVNMFDAGNSTSNTSNDLLKAAQTATATLGTFFGPAVFGSTSFHKIGTPYS
jgi:hypothetical protein